MKTRTKPARGKAVVMYQSPANEWSQVMVLPFKTGDKADDCSPVAVCDLSPAANKARIELAAKAMCRMDGIDTPLFFRQLASAALLAIGVIAAPEKGEKK
jgi:hypothetical protein